MIDKRTGDIRRSMWGHASSLAVAAALMAAGAAHAQSSDNAAANRVDELVVTAQFREQKLQNTPLAITAISGAMLEERGVTSVQDVAQQAPSVTLKPQGSSFGPALGASIRGVGQFDFNPAYEPGVGIYVDDVYLPTLTGSILDLLDLERVEILRGPQGTLTGKNSIGGAVKLYSKKPTGEDSGYVAGAYGSRQRLDLRASANFGITDTLFARISGVAKKQEGYVDRIDYGCAFPNSGVPARQASGDCVVAKEGEVNYTALRGQLRWVPSASLEFNLISDYTHDDRTVAPSVLRNAGYAGVRDINPFAVPIAYDNRFVTAGTYRNYAGFYNAADGPDKLELTADGRTSLQNWGVSLQGQWTISDSLQLVSISAYRQYETDFTNDDDLSPLAHSFARNHLDFNSFSQEVRLNGTFGQNDAVNYTLGLFYLTQKSVYYTLQDVRYAGLPTFIGNDPVKAATQAAFAHVSWKIVDPLTLNLGLRYTDESKDYTFSRRTPAGAVPAAFASLDGYTGSYSGDRFDYRANLQYQWTDDLMTYVQYSTGFKGGGVNPRPFAVGQVQPFGPEVLKSWEVGLKSDFFDHRARINVSAFASKYEDIQINLNSCPQYGAGLPCALPANAGDADLNGYEIEVALRPIDGLTIDASVSHLDFKYTSINPQAGGPTNLRGVQIGMVPIYMPNDKWSAGIQYRFDLGDRGTLTPRLDAAYQSELHTRAVNTFRDVISAYTLANARLTWRNANNDFEVSLEATNITDKYYYLTVFDLFAAAGFTSAQPGRPREWALSVKKSF